MDSNGVRKSDHIKLIMECSRCGLSDYQCCQIQVINPGTFYNWVNKLRKEGDSLPQINLALLYGEESMLPVYYRKLAGNITDVKTIENLIKDVDFLKFEKLKLVMDRGFYSERNINDLMKNHHKFLIGVRMSLNIVKDCFDGVCADFVTRYNYNSELKLYVMSFRQE